MLKIKTKFSPSNMLENGVRLGDSHILILVIRNVRKVQAQAELVIKPAGLVKAWGRATGHLLILIVGPGIFKQQP